MSRIAIPRNTNRKMLYFYIISATSGVKLGFLKGAKKQKEGTIPRSKVLWSKKPQNMVDFTEEWVKWQTL